MTLLLKVSLKEVFDMTMRIMKSIITMEVAVSVETLESPPLL